jgi:small neutral amino acid transporter SnatA (MarC family)
MGTYSKVFAIGFALFAALGGCALIYIAFGELFRRKPKEAGHTRPKEDKERQYSMSLWK